MNAHQFFTEESWDSFKQIFDSYMFEASRVLANCFRFLDGYCDIMSSFIVLNTLSLISLIQWSVQAWIEENEGSSLLETLYKALDEVSLLKKPNACCTKRQCCESCDNIVVQVVKLSECEIYSYDPDSDADPSLEKGAM